MSEVFPVVHAVHPMQALEQSRKALSYGADGVFLIAHNTNDHNELIHIFDTVSTALPSSYIGVNFLQLRSGYEALTKLQAAALDDKIGRLPNGLWVDDAVPRSDAFLELRMHHPDLKAIQYLGGTAFKYTPNYTDNPQEAAEQALDIAEFVDVVTTSGQGTGTPPSIAKIEAMKQQIGEQKLAVASGIDAQNIESFRGLIDMILVASSVETAPYSGIFNDKKLEDFISLAHET